MASFEDVVGRSYPSTWRISIKSRTLFVFTASLCTNLWNTSFSAAPLPRLRDMYGVGRLCEAYHDRRPIGPSFDSRAHSDSSPKDTQKPLSPQLLCFFLLQLLPGGATPSVHFLIVVDRFFLFAFWLRFLSTSLRLAEQQVYHFGPSPPERLTFLVKLRRAHLGLKKIYYYTIRFDSLTLRGFSPEIQGLCHRTSGILCQIPFLLDRRAQRMMRTSQYLHQSVVQRYHQTTHPHNRLQLMKSNLHLRQLTMLQHRPSIAVIVATRSFPSCTSSSESHSCCAYPTLTCAS